MSLSAGDDEEQGTADDARGDGARLPLNRSWLLVALPFLAATLVASTLWIVSSAPPIPCVRLYGARAPGARWSGRLLLWSDVGGQLVAGAYAVRVSAAGAPLPSRLVAPGIVELAATAAGPIRVELDDGRVLLEGVVALPKPPSLLEPTLAAEVSGPFRATLGPARAPLAMDQPSELVLQLRDAHGQPAADVEVEATDGGKELSLTPLKAKTPADGRLRFNVRPQFPNVGLTLELRRGEERGRLGLVTGVRGRVPLLLTVAGQTLVGAPDPNSPLHWSLFDGQGRLDGGVLVPPPRATDPWPLPFVEGRAPRWLVLSTERELGVGSLGLPLGEHGVEPRPWLEAPLFQLLDGVPAAREAARERRRTVLFVGSALVLLTGTLLVLWLGARLDSDGNRLRAALAAASDVGSAGALVDGKRRKRDLATAAALVLLSFGVLALYLLGR